MDPKQFEQYVIAPALELLGLDSPAARALMLGTAAQESGLGHYLRQVGGGPALGVFQMEPATYHDIWNNFLKYHPEITQRLARRWPVQPKAEEMITDLLLAAVMCRLHYRRVSAPLPEAGDVSGLAAYWKRHYNTPQGAGTVSEFVHNWGRLVGGRA
ncbi:MAG: hypothetical protein HQM00_01890 [Magnetococcales bacterium]|nr:hypothetical protein [Magnetococcales bacterium]